MNRYYVTMADGTIKQINPFTGTEVWCVPGRSYRPIDNLINKTARKLNPARADGWCFFCFKKIFDTPPEKSRLVKTKAGYKIADFVPAERLLKTRPLFRRIPNLFEIVTHEYWEKNYEYRLTEPLLAWKKRYLSTLKGRKHTFDILCTKLRLTGKSDAEIRALTDKEKSKLADAFFGGCHEVIIVNNHFVKNARYDTQLFSSGDFTPEEHYQYLRFTIYAVESIYRNNPYVRYVSVFQNWLKEAGASFDHLHKQLVGLDDWGLSIEKERDLVRKNPDIYNELVVNFAIYNKLVVAENPYAIAFSDIGHRYSTLAVYSKSRRCRPNELTEKELRGFSDLVHACHAAMGPHISCNEEWYYMPKDCMVAMPWHILIKWRTLTTAGFEGGTRIYINPTSPYRVRDIIVPALSALRDKRKIRTNIKIGKECACAPNCLKYNEK